MTKPEWITFTTHKAWLEERKKVVTSTEMAALCGVHKYGQTPFGLYNKKLGLIEDEWEASERVEAGLVFENAIARFAGRKLKSRVKRIKDFCRKGNLGASFDYELLSGDYEGWLLECKNVDWLVFRNDWGKDEEGRPVAPEHILIQTQMQLEVSERPGMVLAVLVGGNDLKLVPIARDGVMGQAFHKIADAFIQRIQDRTPPPIVGGDAQYVQQLYGAAKPGAVIEADYEIDDLLGQHIALKAQAKALDAEIDRVKAEVLIRIGDAEKVIGARHQLNASMTKGSQGTLITSEMVGGRVGAKKGHRQFLVKERK